MKIFLLEIIFCCFLLACHDEGKHANKEPGVSTRISDTTIQNFEYHFGILDAAERENPNDSIYVCCTPSIEFMEINTGINAHSEGTLLGKIEFSKSDLRKWHEWYAKQYKKNK